MKHTRVPQTVHRDIWRLAIETSSIPSLHSFRSRILWNQVASRVENRKEPNGPNRRSNQLTKKKIPHTLFYYYLGWLIRCKVCISHEPLFKNNVAVEIIIAVRYFRPSESALRKLCTNINQPYLIWAAVICRHVPSPKDQWYWDPQSNRPKAKIWKVHEVVVVYVVVDDLELLQRRSPAGQLKLKLLNINNCLN